MALPADPVVVQFGGGGASRSVANHAYHGPFWPTGVDLPAFSWEFWACRGSGTSEYIISEGYGGAHAILFDGVQGNIYDGVNPTTTFTSNYTLQAGEWFHCRVGWDGNYLMTWINGILVGILAFAGPRRAQQGYLFIGGSDHSNFFGKIAAARAYEGSCPQFAGSQHFAPWVPSRGLRAVNPMDVQGSPSAQFAASYMGGGGLIIPDTGIGYRGDKHPGILRNADNGHAVDEIRTGLDAPLWVVDTTAPFGAAEVARTRTPATPGSVPGSAKIFDSCGRADSIPAFETTPTVSGFIQTSPGSTEGGSLGVKAWQHVNSQQRWGVFDGALAPMVALSAAGGIYVNNDSGDMDVRVDRKDATGWKLAPVVASRSDVELLLRYQDANNFLWTNCYRDTVGNNFIRLYKKIAGVDTLIKEWTMPNFTWTTQRFVLSGSTITLYIDGTQVGTSATDGQFSTQTGVGLFNWGHAAAKATNFTVL